MSARRRKGRKLTKPRRGRFAAVDFDAARLWIVQAEHTPKGTRFLRSASVDLPEGLDISDPSALGRFLAEALRANRIRPNGLIMNVPRSKVVLKPLVLPPTEDESELAAMVLYQAGRELSLGTEGAVVDYTVETHYDTGAEEEPAGGVEVLVAAVKQEVVEHYRQIAQAADQKLVRLGLRPYADVRALRQAGVNQSVDSIALVHVTGSETEVDVVSGAALTFSRSALVKVRTSEGAFATGQQRDGEDAVGEGPPSTTAGSPTNRERLDEALGVGKSPVDEVVTEAARSLQSYHAVQRGRRIDRVYVAGGTGIEEAVAAKLATRLRVPCEPFDPVSALNAGRKMKVEQPGGFLGAMGLAISDGDAEELPFDFLDPKKPRQKRDVRKLRRMALAAGIILLVGTGVGLGVHHRMQLGTQLAVIEAQLAEEKQKSKPATAMRYRVRALESWQRSGQTWVDHWALLSGLFPPAEQAYIEDLSARSSTLTVRQGKSTIQKPVNVISFTVRATNSEVFQQLVQRLSQAGYDVQPSSNTNSEPSAQGYNYAIGVRLTYDPTQSPQLGGVQPTPRRPGDLFHPANASLVESYFEDRRPGTSQGSRRRPR